MPRPRLRVCHVAYTFYENDNRVRRYAEALAAEGHHVDVIALRRAGQDREGRVGAVNVRRVQPRAIDEKRASDYLLKILLFFVRALVSLTVRHLRGRYDVVHVHNVPDFLVFTALIPKLFGARVILDIHDILPELYAGKFAAGEGSRVFRALLAVERISCRFADHVIVANHLWHAKLLARTLPSDKCTTIMNYPDLSLFVARTEAKAPHAPFVVMYPGTLNHHQGLDIAIRGFALAMERMPGAEFHIYGEGPDRHALERLVKDNGWESRIRLMDRVPITEVAGLMADADLGVVPKRADGFGNEAFSTKILEFMACGVPVVVSRTQVDAYYFDGSLVRFFTPGDAEDLASALVWAFETRSQHAAWIQRGREFAQRYSWQARVPEYTRIIDSLLPVVKRPQAVHS